MTRFDTLEHGTATLHAGLIERAAPEPTAKPASALTPVIKHSKPEAAFDLSALAVKPPKPVAPPEPQRPHVQLVRPVAPVDELAEERHDRCCLTLRVDRELRDRMDRERARTGSTIQAFLHRALLRFLESRSP
jgi:hypothetical protein